MVDFSISRDVQIIRTSACFAAALVFQVHRPQQLSSASGTTRAQTLTLSQVVDNAARKEFGGGSADSSLRTSTDVFLRIGLVAHFDLRIRASSEAGRAIVQAFGVQPLLPREAGEARILKGLQDEKASQDKMVDEDVRQLAVRLERGTKKR